ncbi:MAG: hypothetical protein E6I96_03600 [Chloroflexi bacterium]|nr:MAG: hypothetical protein E6I96_03600 [Chloroflexota bacterium]
MVADSIAGPGGDMREARVALTLDRLISLHQMHEDITLHTYARTPVTVLLEVALESDFADLFEVRYRSWQRRADLNTWWVGPASLESRYQNDDFVRRCLVRALTTAGGMTYANGALRIPADLAPGQEWKICLQYDLLTSDEQIPEMAASCVFEAGDGDPLRHTRSWQQSVSQIEPTDIRLQFAYERAIEDFAALRLHEQDTSRRARAGRTSNEDRWMPAAGLPWFMALFGRDSLIASIQAMVAQPAVAMARSKTWRAGSRMLTTPTATPNQARSRTSFWWGSGRTSESCRTGPITGPRTPHLYICCCWPRTFGGRAMRMRSAISAARRSARWNGSTATAIATATGSRSTRRAHRAAIATRAGVMRTMACSTTAAPFPSCRSPRRRCRPTYTARRLESHRSSSLGRPRDGGSAAQRGGRAAAALHRFLLARRCGRAGVPARWQQKAGPHGGVELGTQLVDGDPRRGAGTCGGAAPDAARHVHRLGAAPAVRSPSLVRPALVSARFGLAARQRHRGRGAAPVRDGGGGVDNPRRFARGGDVL